MDYLKDFGHVFKESAKKTVAYAKYIPILMIVHLLVSTAMEGAMYLIGGTGVFGGIILAIIRAGCYSVYLYVLMQALSSYNIKSFGVKEGVGYYFRDVYLAFFVIYILQLVINLIGIPYLELILIFVFSALPEVIYQGTTQGFDNLTEAIDFIKDNWYIWLPLSIVMAVILAFVGYGLTLFVPLITSGFQVDLLVRTVIHVFVWTLFAIFRGLLFRQLYQSNLRKRKFMARF